MTGGTDGGNVLLFLSDPEPDTSFIAPLLLLAVCFVLFAIPSGC